VSFQAIKTFKVSNDPDFEAKKNRVLELYDIADGKAKPQRGGPDGRVLHGRVRPRPPEYFGYSDSKPSSLKLCSTARTRSSDVNATLAIWATSMPWADSSTICARRHVTTDPELRRTMRSSRWPSSLLISRTRTLTAIPR
jgi:hypothetical protein